MNRLIQPIARFASSPKGSKIVIGLWIVLLIILSGVAPGAKQYAVSTGEGSFRNDTSSAMAQAALNEQFPSKDGLPALLVFHAEGGITAEDRAAIARISEWLASGDKPEHVASSVPFHKLPAAAQDKLLSEDRTTVLLNVSLSKNLESNRMYDTLQEIRDHAEKVGLGGMKLDITGPAGISADTIKLFKNADFVLMFATVGLILVILIVIYRSPLLAVIPLALAGVIYQVVDKLLGLAAKNGWFIVDKQALSIMMILLFAVLTDYCLFVVSRFREELKRGGSKYEAMQAAFAQVAEPILFSGGTVLIAMLTLFAAVFKPYHYFAPVFSVAVVVILLGGLTLIPALFAVIGKKAFWPFVPKPSQEERVVLTGFWTRVGSWVAKKPAITAISLLVLLALASLQVGSMKYSFNLMKSFPSDISSRQGFDTLEKHFPQGQLAPVTVLLTSDREIAPDESFMSKLSALSDRLRKQAGIHDVSLTGQAQSAGAGQAQAPASASTGGPGQADLLSASRHAVKLTLTLNANPYDSEALDAVAALRDASAELLQQSGFEPAHYTLQIAGQTAEQLDVRTMNARDTAVLFAAIAGLIAVMLAFQARSIVMALIMMGTMLLSFTATLGVGWLIFHGGLGYESISYRLPVYTFVFMIALGVDYNIMLVSRIREEAKTHPWKIAVSRGVALTGGVISSAGLILAATFGVLITQPLQELFLFGTAMALGILMDTFLIRGMLLPAILSMLGGGSVKRQKLPSPVTKSR